MRKHTWFVLGCFLLPAAFLAAQPPEILAPDQLDNLVAPVALYPDELLGQVLAASTYPLELVEAQQWLQQNRGLQGPQLMDAARQQNWDPSVQAMVAFPNVLALLSQDVRWTTDLGNAFLAQQADVMNAVQRLRARAQANGRLASTPQQTVTGGPSSIVIQPANPQVIYVPAYNPAYVWGAPAYGAYPPLGYGGYGFSFNPGVLLSAIFSGLMSFGGWGWGLNWLAHALFLNNLFFGHFGFGGGGGYGVGHSMWVHDPGHRLGVAYSNHSVASRYGSSLSARAYSRPYTRPMASGSYSRDYRSPMTSSSYRSPSYRSSTPSYSGAASYRAPSSSSSSNYRRSSYNSAARSTRSEAPARYSAPRSSEHFAKAPKAPKAPKFKAPKSGGGHSGGGHSGGGKHK